MTNMSIAQKETAMMVIKVLLAVSGTLLSISYVRLANQVDGVEVKVQKLQVDMSAVKNELKIRTDE